MEFAVLNPGGRDPTRLFPNGAGSPSDSGHPPVNYHAYAACLSGGFFRELREIPASVGHVLVLLRRNGLGEARRVVEELRRRGISPWISWKESGLHQVAGALAEAGRYTAFCEIARAAEGFISSTPELVALYRAAGCSRGDFIPTPYPVGEPGWDFSRPPDERLGVFLGTREFDVPSRNHALAVAVAASFGLPVTVINLSGARGAKLLRAIGGPNLTIVSGPLAYGDYLRSMAAAKMVFQLDRSSVPGQVAGDALLCGIPCAGGDGAVDRLVFPDLCGAGLPVGEILRRARETLSGVPTRVDTQRVSFPAVASALSALFGLSGIQTQLA